MKERRDRAKMLVSILEAIQNEGNHAKPTHVMYKANLSHGLLKSYFSELKDKNIIIETEEKDNTYISLTEQGTRLLSELRKMEKFMESFGL